MATHLTVLFLSPFSLSPPSSPPVSVTIRVPGSCRDRLHRYAVLLGRVRADACGGGDILHSPLDGYGTEWQLDAERLFQKPCDVVVSQALRQRRLGVSQPEIRQLVQGRRLEVDLRYLWKCDMNNCNQQQ